MLDGAHVSSVDLAWENEGWTANGTIGAEDATFVVRMSAQWVVQQFLLFRDLEEPDLWLATDGAAPAASVSTTRKTTGTLCTSAARTA